MNKYEKGVLFKLSVIKITTFTIIFLNMFLPIYSDYRWRFNFFQLTAVLIYVYASLSALGYILVETTDDNKEVTIGMKVYTTVTPILPLFMNRIMQVFIYALLLRGRLNWRMMLFLYMIDIIYLALLLFDKANYGYMKEDLD